MTDDPENLSELVATLSEPLTIGPGESFVANIDFLDPTSEVEGVIVVQADADGGLWALYGLTDELGGYHQVWFQPGKTLPEAPKPTEKKRGGLKSVN